MSSSRTTSLTLRLIDQVSGPGKAAAATLNQLNKTMRGMSTVAVAPARALAASSRSLTTAANNLAPTGAVISFGAAKMAREVYNLEKQLNISQAAGGLDLSKRNALMEEAIHLNGQYAATSAEIVGGANELLKSGLSYEQTLGALPGILNTAQAMDVPISDATSAIIQSMTSLRMEMGSTDSAMKNSIRTADLFAHALNETAGASLDDFRTSGKYFNPVAAAIGMTPEEAMSYQIALAKNGIYGSSAGTGLRSAPVSIAAPSRGGRAAFGRLGINPADYVGKRTGGVTGAALAATLESQGFNVDGLEEHLDAMARDPRLNKSAAKLAGAVLDRFGEELGVATAEDRAGIADHLMAAINAGSSKIDLKGVLKRLKDENASLADYVGVFGKNHASKMMAINPDDLDHILADAYAKAPGSSQRMREAMMAGIVGDVNELGAAWEKMAVAIGESGLLNDASKAIDKMARSLSSLADTNPELVRFASYAALALAALAPLGFALSGAAAALAVMVNPLAIVVGSLGVLAALNIGPITDFFSVFGKSFAAGLSEDAVARLVRIKNAVGELFAMRLGAGDEGDALGQMARNLGLGAASMANAMEAAIPKIRPFIDGMVELGQGAFAASLPALTTAFQAIESGFSTFASDKVDLVIKMGTALGEFGEKAKPFLDPVLGSGMGLIAQSFQTLGSGMAAVYRVINGVTSGMVAFASAFLNNIDGQAVGSTMKLIADGFTSLGDGLRYLKQGYDLVDLSFLTEWGAIAGGATGSVVGEAIKGVAAAIRTGALALIEAAKLLLEGIAMAKSAIDQLPAFGSFSPHLVPGGFLDRTIGGGKQVTPATPPAGGMWGSAAGGPPQARASGGPITRGMYLVGERGPELLHADGTGRITPNHKLGGATIVNHFAITGGDGKKIGDEIAETLRRQLARSTSVGLDGR